MPKQRGGGRRLWICAFPTGVFHLHASSAGRETEALCRKGVRCPGSQQQPTPDACSLRVHALRIGSLPPRRPKTPLQADSFLAVSSLEGMTRNYKKSFQKKTTVQPFIKPAETLIHQFSDLPSPHGADLATGPPPLVLLPPPLCGGQTHNRWEGCGGGVQEHFLRTISKGTHKPPIRGKGKACRRTLQNRTPLPSLGAGSPLPFSLPRLCLYFLSLFSPPPQTPSPAPPCQLPSPIPSSSPPNPPPARAGLSGP